MKKRFKFRCWKCKKTYSLYRETDLKQKLNLACPFCGAEAIVDFSLFPKKPVEVLRNMSLKQEALSEEIQLPEILSTSKPE